MFCLFLQFWGHTEWKWLHLVERVQALEGDWVDEICTYSIATIMFVTRRVMLVSQAPQGWHEVFPRISDVEEQEGCELTEPRWGPWVVWAGCFLYAAALQPGELETGYSWRYTCSLSCVTAFPVFESVFHVLESRWSACRTVMRDELWVGKRDTRGRLGSTIMVSSVCLQARVWRCWGTCVCVSFSVSWWPERTWLHSSFPTRVFRFTHSL